MTGIGVPPEMFTVKVPLGTFTDGRYTLTYAPSGEFPCAPISTVFQVGTAQAAESVPLSPRMAAVLALCVLLIGSLRLRGLRSSRA